MRQQLVTQLKAYKTEFQEETPFIEQFLDLLTFDDCFLRSKTDRHITGSAWILNQNRDKALLTHHAKLDRWLQLGGHADGEEDILKVAAKEAFEESGIENIQPLSTEIFDIDIHWIPANKHIEGHYHYDIRFLFIAEEMENINFNHEAKAMKWIPLEEINALTDQNDSINRMVEKSKVFTTADT